MTNRLITRAVIATVLGLVGAALGCGGTSPAGPTAPGAPTGPIAVSAISPTRGLTGEPVTVTGTGFVQGATLTLDGVAARVTRVTGTGIFATTPAHAAGTVDVVVTNPGGQSGMLPGGYTFEVISLVAGPSPVTSGNPLTLDWVGPSGRGCNGGGDWIALYPVGAPDVTGAANGHSDLWFVHLCGATSGTSTLSAPAQPGQYEFRYMVGDTSVARSNPVTVSASASPLIRR